MIVRMDTCKAGPSKVPFYKGCVSNMEGLCFKHGRRIIQILARTARAPLYSMQACYFICEHSQGNDVSPGAKLLPLYPKSHPTLHYVLEAFMQDQ